MNLNKVMILGNITRDPEMRTTPSGKAVVTLGVATNRRWTNASGQKQEQAEFHNVVLWGRLAEIANQYLAKGALVLIEGRLQTRTWEGQDGVKRYRTEIIAENMQMGPRLAGAARATTNNDIATEEKVEDLPIIEEETGEIETKDIPF